MSEEQIEKSPFKSKKFVAAMIWNCAWLLLIGLALLKNIDSGVIETMVWACASSCGLYLGGQSFVDSMVRSTMAKFSGVVASEEEPILHNEE